VGGEEMPPGPIAELGSSLSRPRDVITVARTRSNSPSSRENRPEVPVDLAHDGAPNPAPGKVIQAIQLHETRARDVLRQMCVGFGKSEEHPSARSPLGPIDLWRTVCER
jgi:hypothetical protein